MSALDKIRLAKQASGALAQANTLQKNAALEAIAVALEANAAAIINTNTVGTVKMPANAAKAPFKPK